MAVVNVLDSTIMSRVGTDRLRREPTGRHSKWYCYGTASTATFSHFHRGSGIDTFRYVSAPVIELCG